LYARLPVTWIPSRACHEYMTGILLYIMMGVFSVNVRADSLNSTQIVNRSLPIYSVLRLPGLVTPPGIVTGMATVHVFPIVPTFTFVILPEAIVQVRV
jgi:hypothetical protein